MLSLERNSSSSQITMPPPASPTATAATAATATRRRKRRSSTIMIIKPTRWIPPPLHPQQSFANNGIQHFNETDFKPTFYNPNEVKHRRRISSDQCSILETEYLINTKPNATKRHQLADRLGMTPRTVQIWFQNKRAKAKQQQIKSGRQLLPYSPPAPTPPQHSAPMDPFTFDDGRLDPVYLNQEVPLFVGPEDGSPLTAASSSYSSATTTPTLPSSDLPEEDSILWPDPQSYDGSFFTSTALDFYQSHDDHTHYDPSFVLNWMQKTPTDPDLVASIIPTWPYMMIDPNTVQDDYMNFAWDQDDWLGPLHE
ncbi:hypothetical protein [Absidia glauca]|uniref:Homeobox domain-containing protein n=1 Tax=Absidia glauca TaxID=4829 RepID=A0A168QBV9_ABSGL|nr:hypothetical protein [Absidia glauca]